MARGYKGDHERLNDLCDYLAHQLDVNGVNVVLGTEATADVVAAEAPEAVIVAVGGLREGRLEGSASVPVVGFDELPGAELGERVVICGAGAQAVDCALWLLAQGKKIQMVHDAPASEVGKEQSMWVRTYVIPQLTSQGVKIWNSATVEGVGDEGVSITMNGGVPKVLPCDAVVECYDMVPNAALADELTATRCTPWATAPSRGTSAWPSARATWRRARSKGKGAPAGQGVPGPAGARDRKHAHPTGTLAQLRFRATQRQAVYLRK